MANEDKSSIEQSIREAFETASRLQKGTEATATLLANWMESPLGPLLAVGDDEHLHLLCYVDQTSLVRKAALVQKSLRADIKPGDSASVDQAFRELKEYFAGERKEFETPLSLKGSAFQLRVWEELRRIPYGTTISYADLAGKIGRPAAFRAVAQANAQNPIAIIVPCHRVINANGGLGGYNSGVNKKQQLLDFEKSTLEKGTR